MATREHEPDDQADRHARARPARMRAGTGCVNDTPRKQLITSSMSNSRSSTTLDSAALIAMPVLRREERRPHELAQAERQHARSRRSRSRSPSSAG